MELPKFKYHPDPINTGAIKESSEVCECCERVTGYIYTSTIYAEDKIEFICPWCIANGSAAKKYDGLFSDSYPLEEGGISEKIVNEVCKRTPGYNSWQQEEWQYHCDDACAFLGDASKSELMEIEGYRLNEFLTTQMIKLDVWETILNNYEKGGNPAVYKFKCLHCNKVIYTMDFT